MGSALIDFVSPNIEHFCLNSVQEAQRTWRWRNRWHRRRRTRKKAAAPYWVARLH